MKIAEFYSRNKNTINIAIGVILLYGILKMAKGKTLTESQFKSEILKGGIYNPLKGKLIQTSPFGYRTHPVTGKSSVFHNGSDLVLRGGNSLGAPLYAPYSGTIIKNEYNSIGGHQVVLDSGYIKFGFAHLQEKSPLKVGTVVKRGDIIGKLGNSGTGTGPHLHFNVRINDVFVDPIKTLPLLKSAIA